MIADSVAQGAQIITGGKRPDDPARGYFFQPTVIAGLTPEMSVVREELFGPVMPILTFDDPDQAIALANASDYGLAAYVMTETITTAVRISERLEYGMVSINDWLPSTPEMPFGGMKQSGFGREYGSEGLHEYLETKSIYLGSVQ